MLWGAIAYGPMADTLKYMTTEGFDSIRSEYRELLYGERPKLVEVVAWAAGNGDRSENADYIYGKKRLREIDRRLRFLKNEMENAEVVNPKSVSSEKIVFGATVSLEDEDGQTKIYQIVGEHETDLKRGRISWKSPVAKALLGKKIDDEVVIKRPAGDLFVTIIKIEYK
jgi:transcription elongation factor GreB